MKLVKQMGLASLLEGNVVAVMRSGQWTPIAKLGTGILGPQLEEISETSVWPISMIELMSLSNLVLSSQDRAYAQPQS